MLTSYKIEHLFASELAARTDRPPHIVGGPHELQPLLVNFRPSPHPQKFPKFRKFRKFTLLQHVPGAGTGPAWPRVGNLDAIYGRVYER